MTRQHALTILLNHVQASDDPELTEALETLLTPFPPTAWAAAGHEAQSLADLFHKTGLANDWATPPAQSESMLRLIHRLTCLLEASLPLVEQRRHHD
jgi:hypothetical protein